MTEVFGANAPIFLARSRASLTGLPSTAVMTSPASMPAFTAGLFALRFGDQRAFRLLQAEAVGDILRHRLDLHADPAARDRAVVLELADHALDGVGGDREGDADRTARRREDRGVDADHIAFGVEGRTAGIALVHRRVDLDEIVIGAGADVAAARRDDAGGDGAAEAERIADRDHPVADARGLVGELHIGERTALDLDQRQDRCADRCRSPWRCGSCRRRW